MTSFTNYVQSRKAAGLAGMTPVPLSPGAPVGPAPSFADSVRQRREQLTTYDPQEFSQKVDIQRQADRLRTDLNRLGQGTPEKVADWKAIADTVIRLKSADNEDASKYADAIMQSYSEQLRPHTEVVAGADWWDQNYSKPKGPGGWKGVAATVLGNPVVSTILSQLDKPSQGVLHAIAGVRAAIDPNDGISAGDALKHAGSSLIRGVTVGPSLEGREIKGGQFDVDGDGILNAREAFGFDPEAGGLLAGAVDLTAVIALDPLTWASFGTRGLAKGALHGITHQAGLAGMSARGAQIARTIQRSGFKALDNESADYARQWIRQEAKEGVEAYIRTAENPGIRAAATRALRRTDREIQQQIDKRAARMQRAVERGGQRGFKMAGRTVIPYRILLLEELGIVGHNIRQVQRGVSTGIEALEDMMSVAPDIVREAAAAARTPLALNPGPTPVARAALGAGADAAVPAVQEDIFTYLSRAFKGREAEDRLTVQIDVLRDLIETPDILARLGLTLDDIKPIVDEVERRAEAIITDLYPAARNTPDLPGGEARREAAEKYVKGRPARFGADTRRARTAEPTPLTERAGGTPSSRELAPYERPYDEVIRERIADLRRAMDDQPATVGPVSRVQQTAGELAPPRPYDDGPLPGAQRRNALLKRGQGIRGTKGDTPIAGGMNDAVAAEQRRASRFASAEQKAKLAAQGTSGEVPITVPRTVAEAADSLDPENILLRMEREVVETWTYVPGLWDKFMDLGFMRWIHDHFVPRARIIRNKALGRRGAEALDAESAEALGKFNQRMDDVLRRLDSRLVRRAEQQAGGRDELNKILNQALDNPDNAATAVASQSLRGNDQVVQLIADLQQMRQEIYDAAIAGGANRKKLRNPDNYIPRYISPDARKNLERMLDPANDPNGRVAAALNKIGLLDKDGKLLSAGDVGASMDRARAQGGSLAKRGMTPEIQDLLVVNEEVASMLRKVGIDPADVGDLFESDVIKAFALRARTAYEAVLVMDVLKGLSNEVDNLGRRLVYIGEPKDVLSRMADDGANVSAYAHGFDEVLGSGEIVYVNKTIKDEIDETRRILANKTEMNEVLRILNKWNGLWSSYATVPLVGGIGFHSRNATGNVFNAFLGGLRNPARYKEAFGLQRTMHKIHKAMDETGMAFDDAARHAGVSADDLKLINLAREHGIIGSGQTSDVFAEARTGLKGKHAAINPLDQSNKIITTGRTVGTAVEHNARLALFLDGMKKGRSPRKSAANVRKYLFDYSDLTRFESDVLRSLSRFYTFFRKNTALQAMHLVMFPGTIVNAQRVAEEFMTLSTGVLGGDEQDRDGFFGILPSWADDPTQRIFNFGDNTALLQIETPLVSAAETVEKLISGVTLLPGDPLGDVVDYGNREARFAKAMSLLAGGPVEFVDTFYGERFGRDPFSGRILENDTKSQFVRFANAFIPLAGKIDREVAKGTDVDSLRLMNSILGFAAYRMTDDQQGRALRGLKFEALQAVQDLRKKGFDIPSVQELTEAGIIEQQSRALSLLVYEQDEEKLRDGLESILGSQVIESVGMYRASVTSKEEMTEAEIAFRMRDMEAAMNQLRQDQGLPPLTPAEKSRMLLSTSFAPRNADIEALGLEPLSSRNRFIPKAQQQEAQAETWQRLDFLARQWGMSGEQLQALRPRLTDAERVVQEAQAAGMGYDEAVIYLIDNLSRKEQGIIFGTDSLPRFKDGSVTQEELDRAQNRAWQRAAEFNIIFRGVTGQAPREQDVWAYVYWNELNQGQLESLGMPKAPRIPRQQDIRSDRDKLRDAMFEREAVVRGVTEGPAR